MPSLYSKVVRGLTLLFIATAGQAETINSENYFYLVPSVSYYWLDDAGNIEDLPAIGLNAGYQFTSRWAAELGFNWGQGETLFNDDDNMSSLHIDGLYLLSNYGSWQPYAVGSLGLLSFDVDKTRSETTSAAGFGSYYKFTDQIQLRGDARLQYSFDNELIDTVATIGVRFVFGGVTKSSQPMIQQDSEKIVPAVKDQDQDSVVDSQDHCLNSPIGADVLADGCAPLHEEHHSLHFEIHFGVDSAALLPEYEENIIELADFLKTYPEAKLRVTGYADSTGSEAVNLKLSQQRAQTVTNILHKQYGIESSRLSAVGRGEADPIASNRTEEGRAQNRRDIAIVKAHVWVK